MINFRVMKVVLVYKKEREKMNKIMKGYGVWSVLERTSYTNRMVDKRCCSSRAVLELDVYKRDKSTKKKIWRLLKIRKR